jgi:hypothetical protein
VTSSVLKAYGDLAAALFALLAAIAWFIAARHPVTLPKRSMWAESPASRDYIAQTPKIVRGIRWNTAAAILTGCSALATFLSWVTMRL